GPLEGPGRAPSAPARRCARARERLPALHPPLVHGVGEETSKPRAQGAAGTMVVAVTAGLFDIVKDEACGDGRAKRSRPCRAKPILPSKAKSAEQSQSARPTVHHRGIAGGGRAVYSGARFISISSISRTCTASV